MNLTSTEVEKMKLHLGQTDFSPWMQAQATQSDNSAGRADGGEKIAALARSGDIQGWWTSLGHHLAGRQHYSRPSAANCIQRFWGHHPLARIRLELRSRSQSRTMFSSCSVSPFGCWARFTTARDD